MRLGRIRISNQFFHDRFLMESIGEKMEMISFTFKSDNCYDCVLKSDLFEEIEDENKIPFYEVTFEMRGPWPKIQKIEKYDPHA